jgi:trk system potassium uptake protein TrkA
MDLTVIVSNYEEAKEISRTFPEVLVLNGDVRNEQIFEEENLSHHDLIVTITNNQELNVLTSLYSKSIGIKRAVATVNKPNYISIAKKLGVDVTVSPKRSAVDAILKYIRKGQIKTFYSLFDGDAEAIEFIIPDNCKVNDKTLKEIKMPKDSIIVATTRDDKSIVPDGNYTIKSGDHLVVVYKSSSASKIESLFSGN